MSEIATTFFKINLFSTAGLMVKIVCLNVYKLHGVNRVIVT